MRYYRILLFVCLSIFQPTIMSMDADSWAVPAEAHCSEGVSLIAGNVEEVRRALDEQKITSGHVLDGISSHCVQRNQIAILQLGLDRVSGKFSSAQGAIYLDELEGKDPFVRPRDGKITQAYVFSVIIRPDKAPLVTELTARLQRMIKDKTETRLLALYQEAYRLTRYYQDSDYKDDIMYRARQMEELLTYCSAQKARELISSKMFNPYSIIKQICADQELQPGYVDIMRVALSYKNLLRNFKKDHVRLIAELEQSDNPATKEIATKLTTMIREMVVANKLS